MGTPDFAVPTLKALVASGHEISAVVTQPDRPGGRGKKLRPSPVKVLAGEHGIEVLQPEKASDPAFCERIREKEPDLIIVVAYGQILRKRLLAIPGWGVINIHASLLPKLRGAAPIQWAVLNDEPITGLTIMQMDEGLDTGPILYQEEVPILRDETAGQLHDRLAAMGGELMVRCLERMSEGRITEKAQDHAASTYAPKIEKEMAMIDWAQPVTRIYARIRGLDPSPGAYALLKGNAVKLFSSTVLDDAWDGGVPGRVANSREGELVVETGLGRVGIREIQYPGKKRLPVSDFLRGFPVPEGTLLGG